MSTNIVQVAVVANFFSREGYQVNFYAPDWSLSKDVRVPVAALDEVLDSGMSASLKQVLRYYAQSYSAPYVLNLFNRCRAYLESTVGLEPFSVESLISYRSKLNERTQWYVGIIRIVLRQWSRLGYPGLSVETMGLLDKWVIKGNEKGFAVQSMCPESGPLTDVEMEGLLEAINKGFGEGRLTLEETTCAMLFASTGRRPVQISALKVKDLAGYNAGKYWINVPRAKQRGQSWRSQFRKCAVTEDLWLLLRSQASAVEASFEEVLGQPVPGKLVNELPLFPSLKNVAPGINLQVLLDGDFLHAPTQRMKTLMQRVENITAVISERTGGPLSLNPNRFRYTLGTNLAREGLGELIIAEALDHSDTQNVGVYVKNVPEIVERIDKAVALQLAPLAQAFRGVLVASERDARRGDDPSSRISDGRANVGTCGSYGFCGALAPVACYTCAHFQPWLDGPHEEVLDRLLEERDRVRDNCGDLKIASTNDRLILAVSDVVNRCREAREDTVHV